MRLAGLEKYDMTYTNEGIEKMQGVWPVQLEGKVKEDTHGIYGATKNA